MSGSGRVMGVKSKRGVRKGGSSLAFMWNKMRVKAGSIVKDAVAVANLDILCSRKKNRLKFQNRSVDLHNI